MRHLLLIDPLEKLNIKKDSSLMLALSLIKKGLETYVFFPNDFSINNVGGQELRVYSFEGSFAHDGCYLDKFSLSESKIIMLDRSDVIHMRLDPPLDSRYLRTLWMLDHLVHLGIKVMNAPRGIMNFNEKLYAYRSKGAAPSFVGENLDLAKKFMNSLMPSPSEVILKPMDLYSGIGVEKLSASDWEKRFISKVQELQGPVILQPFLPAVKKGEIRSLFFKGEELGSILKTPREGEFLSNIAQGARFHAVDLDFGIKNECQKICQELSSHGVDWVAFDILEEAIQEVNITCPGLLVEVSFAHQKNLAQVIIERMI